MPKHQSNEVREEKRLQRLGTRTPSCVACGETDSRVMELHHIAGQKHHGDTAIVCRNCHRKLSDQQFDHPADQAGQNSMLATIGHYLVGLADLLVLLASTLVEFGKSLIKASQEPAALAEGRQP